MTPIVRSSKGRKKRNSRNASALLMTDPRRPPVPSEGADDDIDNGDALVPGQLPPASFGHPTPGRRGTSCAGLGRQRKSQPHHPSVAKLWRCDAADRGWPTSGGARSWTHLSTLTEIKA